MTKLLSTLTLHFEDLLSLIYPNICVSCNDVLVKQEKLMCSNCNIGIPRTYFHLVNGNPIEQLFWGRTTIEKASSFFILQKGSRYQSLLYELKYKGNRDIGAEFGKRYAAELKEINCFDEIDIIVPVPLHQKKEKIRGYNQSLAIAEGLALNLNKEINSTNLFRKHFSETQTRKGRFERWENVNDLFELNDNEIFSNKHILLVDDVVTTGSTLEACANAILKSKKTKVSIVTLAFATI